LSNETDDTERSEAASTRKSAHRESEVARAVSRSQSLQRTFVNLEGPEMLRKAMMAQSTQYQYLARAALAAQNAKFLQTAQAFSAQYSSIVFRQQQAVQAAVRLQQSYLRTNVEAVSQVIASQQFRLSVLANARPIITSFSNLQAQQGIKDSLSDVESKPEFSEFVASLADTIESDSPAGSDELAAKTTDLLNTDELVSAAEALLESAELDPLLIATAETFEAAEAEQYSDADVETLLSDEDAEAIRKLLQTYAIGHVVIICLIIGIVSGQFLVALGVLAAVAEISGYSLRDLIRLAKRQG
jgi:hypothetical protein